MGTEMSELLPSFHVRLQIELKKENNFYIIQYLLVLTVVNSLFILQKLSMFVWKYPNFRLKNVNDNFLNYPPNHST